MVIERFADEIGLFLHFLGRDVYGDTQLRMDEDGIRASFTFFIQAFLACEVRLIETFLKQIDDWKCGYSERNKVIKSSKRDLNSSSDRTYILG